MPTLRFQGGSVRDVRRRRSGCVRIGVGPKPAIARSRVDLPEPEGPRKAKNSPWRDLQVHAFEHLGGAERQAKVLDDDASRLVRHACPRLGPLGDMVHPLARRGRARSSGATDTCRMPTINTATTPAPPPDHGRGRLHEFVDAVGQRRVRLLRYQHDGRRQLDRRGREAGDEAGQDTADISGTTMRQTVRALVAPRFARPPPASTLTCWRAATQARSA